MSKAYIVWQYREKEAVAALILLALASGPENKTGKRRLSPNGVTALLSEEKAKLSSVRGALNHLHEADFTQKWTDGTYSLTDAGEKFVGGI